MTTNVKAIWEGRLSLKNIKWGNISLPEFVLNGELNQKRKESWIIYLKENPEDYNGRLLYLYNFQIEDNIMELNLGSIQFSTVIYMVKNNIPVNAGLGMIGVQCLIFSPCERYIVVGKRSLSQFYYPGALTIPGGILEDIDLKSAPHQALMREIHEEVSLEFQNDNYLNALLIGWNNVSVTLLLSTKIRYSDSFNHKERIYSDKNEWCNDLKWFPLVKLKMINPEQLLDGLLYIRSKILFNGNYMFN